MADDLNDLEGVEIWRADVNWREVPSLDFDFSRTVLEFTTTVTDLITISQEKPEKQNFLVTNRDKAEEYTLLEKIAVLKGRWARFWFMDVRNLFTLNGVHGAGSLSLSVFSNNYNYRGYERVYIKLKSGDLLTYKMTDYEEDGDTADLSLNTATDRIISPSDIARFSLLRLCRLDVDEIELRHESSQVSECNLRIVELPQEYEEIEA